MQIVIELNMRMVAYHKTTMQKLTIDKNIRQSYNEDSEEYKTICENYEQISGMKREENKDAFDKELVNYITTECGKQNKESVAKIMSVYKESILENKNAWIEFEGCVLNANDFCAIKLDGFSIKASKQ